MESTEPGGQEGNVFEENEKKDIVLQLSEDILFKIMSYLDPDDIGTCCTVSRGWTFTQREEIFEAQCKRIYPSQTGRPTKKCGPRFGGSWRVMLCTRPRLRSNGVYIMTHVHVKKPTRDMFTTLQPGTILECVYHRCFRFLNDGRLLYTLTGGEMGLLEGVRLLWPQLSVVGDTMPSGTSSSIGNTSNNTSHRVAHGHYMLTKNEGETIVVVTVREQHATIMFKFALGAAGNRGKFNHLQLLEHHSIASADPRGNPCKHLVGPSDAFVFWRVPLATLPQGRYHWRP